MINSPTYSAGDFVSRFLVSRHSSTRYICNLKRSNVFTEIQTHISHFHIIICYYYELFKPRVTSFRTEIFLIINSSYFADWRELSSVSKRRLILKYESEFYSLITKCLNLPTASLCNETWIYLIENQFNTNVVIPLIYI